MRSARVGKGRLAQSKCRFTRRLPLRRSAREQYGKSNAARKGRRLRQVCVRPARESAREPCPSLTKRTGFIANEGYIYRGKPTEMTDSSVMWWCTVSLSYEKDLIFVLRHGLLIADEKSEQQVRRQSQAAGKRAMTISGWKQSSSGL